MTLLQESTLIPGFGSSEDDNNSARGSPSAMELTVGGTVHRLDRTLNEEVTHLTQTSVSASSSTNNAANLAAAAARRAARQAAFRASKNSSGVSFEVPPPTAMTPDDPAAKIIQNQVHF